MKSKSRFAKLTSLALLVATLTIYTASRTGAAAFNAASATAAQTEVTPTTDFAFGGICIERGQNALIIVVCLPDPNARDQQPVDVEFMFHDQDGNLLASERQTLLPGHASSFEIRAGIGVPQRSLLSPCVRVFEPNGPRADCIVPTLEVWDTATGKAHFVLHARKA